MAVFKSLRSAKRLVYGQLGLYRRMIKVHGSRYIHRQLVRAEKMERILAGHMIEMEDWSRSHRRLHGRPAIVDDFLIAHSQEIRVALDELTAIVEEIEAVRLLDEHFEVLDNYKLSLHAAWALVLDEDEQHQIQRLTRPPVTRVRWQEPEEVTPITNDDLLGALGLLANVLQAQKAAATAALFGPPADRMVWN